MEIESLWKLVLDDLQVTISPASYTSWVKPLTLTQVRDVAGERLIAEVACPSSFHQSIIDQRFWGQIKEAFDRASEKQVELKVYVDPSLTTSKAKGRDQGPLFAGSSQPSFDEVSIARQKMGLREDFTLDTFAVSSSNEMAHAAAVAITENFGKAYNPLFLYGGVGVGKTHLMQAVANAVIAEHPKKALIFCAGEEFTNEIIDAIQQKNTREFKRRYRKVAGLFIDDIQFIAGKTTVQEEFFHTFNAILNSGGQVVMTSDRPPGEIKALEDRLRSRFEAGLIVDIGQPDFELRSAITLIKARQRAINLSMEAAQAIAANIESARQIEGFLVRLMTEVSLRKTTISTEIVLSLLGKAGPRQEGGPPPLRPMEIIRGVAEHFGVSSKQVRGKVRQKTLVTPRHVAMYLLRVDYNLPLTEVGSLFSDRDHTTVMHAVDKIAGEMQASERLRTDVSTLRSALYQR